jgi:hypothetical protein
MTDRRRCAEPGCTNTKWLRADNTLGYCREHKTRSPLYLQKVGRWKALNKPAVAASAKKRNSRPEQKKRDRVRLREKYQIDADYRARMQESTRKRRARMTPDERADEQYRHKFGITRVEALARLAAQGGCCAMCQQQLDGLGRGLGRGALDHCHKTGRIRGVLCLACNVGLGHYETVRAAAERYLEAARDRARPESTVLPVVEMGQAGNDGGLRPEGLGQPDVVDLLLKAAQGET